MSSISCLCGECELTLSKHRPMMSLFCACKDCSQAMKWCAVHGGKAPPQLPKIIYARSDIVSVRGKSNMGAFQLRKNSTTTRIYCTKCFSILGVNHPVYSDNVFALYPQHCSADLDLSLDPCAAIFMISYDHEDNAEIPNDIPVFYKFDYPQEWNRFMSVEEVKNSFRKPENPPIGKTFTELIDSLGEIKILDLEVGAEPSQQA